MLGVVITLLALLALGRLQRSQGQQEKVLRQAQDKAVESFSAAVEITLGWGRVDVALGNVLLTLGDREGAAMHSQQAQIADADTEKGLFHDFAAQLAGAEPESRGPNYVRNDYFVKAKVSSINSASSPKGVSW